MKKPRYGPEIKAQARELREAGHSYPSIARLLDVPSSSTVRYWLDPSAATKSAAWREQNRAHIRSYNIQYHQQNKDIIAAKRVEYDAAYRKQNSERIAAYQAQYREQNRDRKAEYNAEYRKQNKESIAEYRKKNRDKIAQQDAQYRKQNPEKNRAKASKRRADMRNATPPWFTKDHQRQIIALHVEAVRLERETGIKYHVDHIYPLIGKTRVNGKYIHTSCGLHVPWNLKVLPGPENCRKNCKLPDPATDPPTAW